MKLKTLRRALQRIRLARRERRIVRDIAQVEQHIESVEADQYDRRNLILPDLSRQLVRVRAELSMYRGNLAGCTPVLGQSSRPSVLQLID